MSKIYHYLASANTGEGFVDYFSSILSPNKKGFIYILKGGPGTGKSTMLKKIGKHFENLGLDVEYFHCSSDFNSLDGVKIVKCNIAIIDGTAPHSKDSSLPMIDDKIIDLSEYFNTGVKAYADEIKALIEKKQFQYKIVYNYLSCLKNIETINLDFSKEKFDNKQFEENYLKIIKQLNLTKQNKQGNIRKLFLEYFDDNQINTSVRFNEYTNSISLDNDIYTNLKTLENLSTNLEKLGYDFIKFYNTITNKLCAIHILENDSFVFCNNIENNKNINLNIKNKLIKLITNNLLIARRYHKNIEKYYVKAVDFNKINILTNKLINLIQENLN